MHIETLAKTMNYENYDPSFPDQPVVDLYLPLWANLPAFRYKPAFIWVEDDSPDPKCDHSSTSLTYSQLNESVQHISHHLLYTEPLQRRDTVVILCSPGLELVEIIFASQRAGLLAVPISPPDLSSPKQNYYHLVRVLSQTNPKAAIAHPSYITAVRNFISLSSNTKLVHMLENLHWISTDDIKNTGARHLNLQFSPSPYEGCTPDELYLIQYTSGTTGIPKPVLVTAGSAAHNVRTARKSYDLHPNSVIVSWLPQYHDCGLMFLLLTIVSGATCALTSPKAFVKRPRIWLELITNFSATCTPVPSFTLPLVVKRGGVKKGTSPINLWSMKNLILINEPIYKDAVDEFVDMFGPYGLSPLSISPSYGLAENCTFVSTAWRYNSSNVTSHNKLLPSARLGYSREDDVVKEDMDIVVVNEETCEAVEDGIEGEIWVSSPSNASGYLGHPSLTREVYHGRLRNKVTCCYVRTGDRGVVKGEERFLYVTGRCVDVIKLQNDREIHPHYIETAAQNSSPVFIRAGCLAALKIENTVVVVAEMQRSDQNDVRVLRRICQGIREGVVKEEGVEVGVVVLVKSGGVPKTTSGKIQRWAAKDTLVGGKMSVLMEMGFGVHYTFSTFGRRSLDEGSSKGKSEEKKREGQKVEVRDHEISFSFSSATTRPPLLSLL
ncbi:putative AMP-dependent synthetase/ligase [Rosa chinensis]|uniref:Putative AMP-dependent synthetase/ligase n=2 Tax=Rosa chinensis TaxID=74649 RepID=A0A2P6PYM6_ROSCH|nr:putative AMP-dependent synthetase/ligase [Rosa chinensis]